MSFCNCEGQYSRIDPVWRTPLYIINQLDISRFVLGAFILSIYSDDTPAGQ